MIAFPNAYGYDAIPDASPSTSTASQAGAAMASRVASDPSVQVSPTEATASAQAAATPAVISTSAYNVALSPLAAAIAAMPTPTREVSEATPPVTGAEATSYDAFGRRTYQGEQPDLEPLMPNEWGPPASQAAMGADGTLG